MPLREENAESLKTVKLIQRVCKELTNYTKTSPETPEDYKNLADYCVTESKGTLKDDTEFFTVLYHSYCASLSDLNHHDVSLTAMQAAIDYYTQKQSAFLQIDAFRDFLEYNEKTKAVALQYKKDFTAAKEKFAQLVHRNPQDSGIRLDYALSLAMATEVVLALEQLAKVKQLLQFDIDKNTIERDHLEKQLAKTNSNTDILTAKLKILQLKVKQDQEVIDSLPTFERNFQKPEYIQHIRREFGKKLPPELQNSIDGKKLAEQGVQAYQNGKFEDAINFFEKALEETNDLKNAVKIYYNAGRAYEKLKIFPSACNQFNRAFSLSIKPYLALLEQAVKEAPELDHHEKLLVKMVALEVPDESCQNLNFKDMKKILDVLCEHLRIWGYEPLAKRINRAYELKLQIVEAITQTAKYFIAYSQMLRFIGNFETPVKIARVFIRWFKEEMDPNNPDSIKILQQLEKDAEMAAKIIPIISTNQKQVDDDSLAVLQEYLRYEPNNPIVSSFCKLRSITLPPNPVQQVMNDFGNLATAAGSSTISFVLRTLQKKEQTEDSSSTPLQDLTTTAPAATPLCNPISLPK